METKRLLAGALSVCLLLTLAGCHGEDRTGEHHGLYGKDTAEEFIKEALHIQ